MTAKDPTVAQAVNYYKAKISTVKTIDAFLNDYRLFSFAMKAYGLSDMTYAKGFMRKILTEGATNPSATARKLTDPRYLAFAKAFDFKGAGKNATTAAAATSTAVSKYIQQTMEDNAGKENQGVKLALYFRRQAPSVTSAYGILADPALLKVVRTTFSIPAQSSSQSIETQAANISKALNIADLKNPAKLEKIIARFTAMYDLQTANAPGAQNDASNLYASPLQSGFSNDLMMSIQSLTKGGN